MDKLKVKNLLNSCDMMLVIPISFSVSHLANAAEIPDWSWVYSYFPGGGSLGT